MFEGKLKGFKKLTYLPKTRDFHDWVKSRASRQDKSPKHLKQKFWKNFLSVFHNWKFHPWESRKVSRKNSCVPLATRPSTREQVARLSREKH